MLGFSSLSESPLSQASTVVLAFAVISAVTSVGSIQAVTTDAQAFTVSTSIAASFTADPLLFDADANLSLGNTSAVTSAANFFDVFGLANSTPSAVTAIIAASDFAGIDAKALTNFSSVVADIDQSVVDTDAKANITTSNVLSILEVSNFFTSSGKAFITLPEAPGQFFVNLSNPVAVIFPYQAFADDYFRGRTLFINAYDKATTVHVGEESRTTFVTKPTQNYIIHVVPENRTVVIEKQQGSNTVHIAA